MQKSHISKVFKLEDSQGNPIYPPDQVFANPAFNFMLTIGGYFVDNEKEYNKFMNLLKDLGESEFYIVKNLVENIPNPSIIMSVDSSFQDFDKKARVIDMPEGFIINHFFVFGKNPSWGIYVCEYPSINIIGCIPVLEEKFRRVFKIKGNGYTKLESFIWRELNDNSNLKNKLIANYKL